ncbi:hypothetical protein ABW19_dt0201071 [Dactylella cylindrospora]|nr:hypothetical protein ABW19_dt0201071 [Dactylella cylindrospora]
MAGDNYDIDSFLDLSGGLSDSNRPSSTGSSTVFPEAPHLTLNQNFSAPSHQYELHTQQTGLLPYSMNFSENSTPNRTPNQSSMSLSPEDFGGMNFSGMDLENDSLFPTMQPFFPESSFDNDFVNPSDVNFGSQEVDIDALAGIKSERSKSTSSVGSSSASSSQGKKKSSAAPDPATEERIRQILEDVKRKALSTQPTVEEDSSMPQIARAKKDEEDMDEDERLLASEEGKKLSSKERRQLRNKVSARAFRSRRKEYIGQLESEVATKSTENVELRRKLNAIEAENKSLKDLTRMLLASPQFASFLDQMNPLSAGNIAAFTAPSTAPQQNSMSENITVHRASIPHVQIQQPAPVMHDFQVPSYIPPHQQFLNTYNPRKDVNPNRSQAGVEEWPLAYPAPGSWGMGPSTVYAAEVPEIIVDANELLGKDDLYVPADGFRPGSFKPVLKDEKDEAKPDFSNSYDSNGQYIFDVFEDELEAVPDYLYSHFDIHAPLSQKEEEVEPPRPEDVLPALGLENLFTTLEHQFFPVSPEPTDVLPESPVEQATTETCRDPELTKTLRSIESTYRSVGALCGL